ncbi:MAG TPA: hypothetical protein G4O15_12505 [Dehalococcoidia bacterium]|nr:hypothetical protein [Dehalococcoidia bacterium]
MIEKYIAFIYQALDTLSEGNPISLAILFSVLTLHEFGIPFPLVLQGVRFYIGYEISQGSLETLLLVLIFIIGRQCGASIIYWVSRLSSNAILDLYPKRFTRIRNETERIREKLQSKRIFSIGTVIIGRFTPGLMIPTSIAAGSIKLNYYYFIFGVLASSILFDATFITLAALFGRQVSREGLNVISWLILSGFIGLTIILWVINGILKRRKRPREV